MKRPCCSEEPIIGILKEVEAGLKVADACRNYCMSQWTLHTWRKKYQGRSVSEAKKFKDLKEENRRMKQLVANLSLDNAALEDILSENW
jgi:putative transposase